jgi:hypothetical protein
MNKELSGNRLSIQNYALHLLKEEQEEFQYMIKLGSIYGKYLRQCDTI